MADNEFYFYGPKVENSKNPWGVGEYFHNRIAAGGDKIAQIVEFNAEGVEESLKYSEILHSAKVVAGLLRKHGLTTKDTVMSVTGNTLEYAPIMWSTLFVGATIAPVNPLYEYDDMAHFVKTIRPQIMVCNKHAEATMRRVLENHDDKNVVFITVAEMYKYLAENPSEEGFELGKIEDPDTQIATVLCTSGSSGKPKCAEICHTTIMRQMDLNYLKSGDKQQKQEVSVNIAGPFGVTGQTVNLLSLNSHMICVLVPIEMFTDIGFLNALVKYRINFLVMSPSHLVALVKSAEGKTYDLSSLKSAIVGGSPVSKAMQELAREKFKINITPAYGSTETVGVCNPAYGMTNRPGTVGKLADNVVAKVIDITTGKLLGPKQEGELCLKAPYALRGFRNNIEATKDIFDSDGFFHTGDTGFFDDDGYLYVVDRIKEHIKYKNVHIPATDIEEVLLRHPKVQEACCIGVHHDTDWEHATAIVVVKKGETVTEEELVKLVQDTLPQFKWLHGGVKFVDSLPYSLNAKIQKRELREKYNARPTNLPTIADIDISKKN